MTPHHVLLMKYCAGDTDRLLLDGEPGKVNGRTGPEEVGKLLLSVRSDTGAGGTLTAWGD